VIASMFNLDHRLAELRPTEQEQRLARDLRRAAAPAARPDRSASERTRSWSDGSSLTNTLSRPAAG
jgi:hypothetical protein